MGDHLVGPIWLHSYEEDDDCRVVYHGNTHKFPRSRRPRESLTLESGGRWLDGRPGPADNLIPSIGSWRIAGNLLTLQRPGSAVVYEIETVTRDTLILRRQAIRDD
jgi:hypothetical protein